MTATPATPQRTYLTISAYMASPGLTADVFVNRHLTKGPVTTMVSRHYRRVSPDSLGRLAYVVTGLVMDDTGKVYPLKDGWSYQGYMAPRAS